MKNQTDIIGSIFKVLNQKASNSISNDFVLS